MTDYNRAINRLRVGAADPSPLHVPATVVRQDAKIAAGTSLNKHKKFFGYGRLVPQADIAPADQILTKNSDDQAEMEKWLEKTSGDPQMIWAGYFDNASGKLVGDSIGESITVTPDKPPPPKKKSMMGWLIGGVAAGFGLLIASRKRRM